MTFRTTAAALLAVLLCGSTASNAADVQMSVWCSTQQSYIISTGIFTDSTGATVLRVCCGGALGTSNEGNYDLTTVVDGSTKRTSCDSSGVSCCYDVTATSQTFVPYPLSGVADADELPHQPSYVRDDGTDWLYWTSDDTAESRGRVWADNMAACQAGGGMLLDLPMLAAGPDAMASPAAADWDGPTQEVAAMLNALPTQFTGSFGNMHTALRSGFPVDPTCDTIDVSERVALGAYKTSVAQVLAAGFQPSSNVRSYWEASGVYSDVPSAQSVCVPGGGCSGTDCCCSLEFGATGALTGQFSACGFNQQQPALCFKQRDFGRVITDMATQYLTAYVTWNQSKTMCEATPGQRLLLADTYYKRQYALSAMIWNDPAITSSPISNSGGNSAGSTVVPQGAIGMLQSPTAAWPQSDWTWTATGQSVNASSLDPWYNNSDYIREPQDYPSNPAAMVYNTPVIEKHSEDAGSLGIAGGSAEGIDYCAKKPPLNSIMANMYLGALSGVPLTAAVQSVMAGINATTHVENAGFLDIGYDHAVKTLCEVVAPARSYATFELANCAAYRQAIAGVAFNAQAANGSHFLETRCTTSSPSAIRNQTLLAWSSNVQARGVNVSASQVGFCPEGIATFSLTMGTKGLQALQPICGTIVPASSSGLSGGAIAGIVIGVLCLVAVCLALVLCCFWRRRQAKKQMLPSDSLKPTLADGRQHFERSSAPYWTSGDTDAAVAVGIKPGSNMSRYQSVASSSGGNNSTLSEFTEVSRFAGETLFEPMLTHITGTVKDTSSTAAAMKLAWQQISVILKLADGVVLERYRLQETCTTKVGGQGLVHFANGMRSTTRQYAVKFFAVRAAFNAEMQLYCNPALRHVLPPVDDAQGNEDGRWLDPMGRPLPPMMVMEKGEPLDEYVRRAAPDSLMTLALTGHLMEAVAKVHAAGLVHRDIKPSNTLWIPSSNSWTLIDFGSAAPIGDLAHMSITARYAAPETAIAYKTKAAMVEASTAVDVWALGVMAYELFTKSKVFPPGTDMDQVFDALTGKTPLPWEDSTRSTFAMELRQLGRMRRGVLSMLHRDPHQRARLDDVRADWQQIFHGVGDGSDELVGA